MCEVEEGAPSRGGGVKSGECVKTEKWEKENRQSGRRKMERRKTAAHVNTAVKKTVGYLPSPWNS